MTRPASGPSHAAALHIDTERTWRGGENQLRMLLTHPVAAAWTWHLAAPPGSEVIERLQTKAQTVAVPMRGLRMISAAATLAKYVRVHRIGLVVCQSSRAHSLGLMVRGLVPGVRVVVHRRVDYAPTDSWWSRRKYLTPRVDRYICISDAVTRVLRTYGVPTDRLVTIHDAVDPAPYAGRDRAATRDRFVREWGLAPDTVIIGNVAYLTEQKGHDTLVRALSLLKTRAAERPFFCYVAGSGPLELAVRRLAAAVGLGDRHLRFLALRDDIPDLLAATDVFALSSNDEGLGSSLLDAASAGCALVATSVGGIPEVVIDGETGLLAPARDPEALARQLARLISDAGLRATLAAGAQRHVAADFSWDRTVEHTLRTYADAGNGH